MLRYLNMCTLPFVQIWGDSRNTHLVFFGGKTKYQQETADSVDFNFCVFMPRNPSVPNVASTEHGRI